MKRRIVLHAVIVLAAVLVGMLLAEVRLPAPATAQAPIKLKMQASWPASSTFMDNFKMFADRVKRAGENISASEVEDTLKQHPAVFDAAVVGVPDPVRDQAIKAYVILAGGARCGGDELIAWCAARLSKFKVPEVIEFRDTFPRTSVGKIQKHLL